MYVLEVYPSPKHHLKCACVINVNIHTFTTIAVVVVVVVEGKYLLSIYWLLNMQPCQYLLYFYTIQNWPYYIYMKKKEIIKVKGGKLKISQKIGRPFQKFYKKISL